MSLAFFAAFFGSFFLTLALVPVVQRFAEKNDIMDFPSLRKLHGRPVPRLGGLAIYLGVVIMSLLLLDLNPRLTGFFWGGTFILIIGLLDDILDLNPRTKLAGQIIAALIPIFFGIRIHYVTDLFGLGDAGLFYLGLVSLPVTIFWIVALTNTMNLIDGLDGLCAGIAVIASMTLALVQVSQNRFAINPGVASEIAILLMLAGSCLGFLYYNFHPATIFMGDGGSLFLGYSLSLLSIMGSLKGATLATLVIPLLALGFPVFDTLFAILRRRFMGKPIFEADKEHTHHQLLRAGLSHRRVVILLYFISALFGFSALLISWIPARQGLMVLGLELVFILGGMGFMIRRGRLGGT